MLSALLFSATLKTAQFRDPIRDITRNVKLPSLESLIRRQRPIEMLPSAFYRMADTRFDQLNPKFLPLSSLERTPDGKFKLPEGAYEGWFETYCLGIGARVAEEGHGARFGKWTGSRVAIVQRILRESPKHPSLKQIDIQYLLWGILAEVKPRYFRPNVMEAARTLLRPEDLALLEADGLDDLPQNLVNQVANRLPKEVQELYRAEARLRSELMKGSGSFERLQQIAVPGVNRPRRELPETRWTMHPNGYLIRMRAFGYSSARVQVLRPRALQYRFDELGRITLVADRGKPLFEIEYAAEPPRPHPTLPRLFAYRFARITTYRPGTSEKFTLEGKGYTFVTLRQPEMAAFAGRARQEQSFWERWFERGQQAQETYQNWQDRRDWAGRIYDPQPGDVDQLADREHLQNGMDAAFGGDPGDRLEWIAENQQRSNEALLRGLFTLDQLPTESTVDFEPEPYGGQPAGVGNQGLGISSRGAPSR